MGALRNLLANAATLLVRLKEAAAPPPAPLAATAADEAAATSGAAADWDQTPEGLRCARGAAPALRAQDRDRRAALQQPARRAQLDSEVPARDGPAAYGVIVEPDQAPRGLLCAPGLFLQIDATSSVLCDMLMKWQSATMRRRSRAPSDPRCVYQDTRSCWSVRSLVLRRVRAALPAGAPVCRPPLRACAGDRGRERGRARGQVGGRAGRGGGGAGGARAAGRAARGAPRGQAGAAPGGRAAGRRVAARAPRARRARSPPRQSGRSSGACRSPQPVAARGCAPWRWVVQGADAAAHRSGGAGGLAAGSRARAVALAVRHWRVWAPAEQL